MRNHATCDPIDIWSRRGTDRRRRDRGAYNRCRERKAAGRGTSLRKWLWTLARRPLHNGQRDGEYVLVGLETSAYHLFFDFERPLSGVLVCALSSPKLAVECGETDDSGKYAVIGLPVGSYVVGFNPEAPWSVQFYNGAATYAKAVPVSVTAGHATAGIDASVGLTRGVEPPFPTPPPRPVLTPPAANGGAPPATSGSTSAAAGGGVLAAGPTSSPPAPHLALRGSHVKHSGRRLLLELSCTGAACRGRVMLTARVLHVVHGHRRAIEVVLGAASFDIAPGRRATIALHLTRAGRARLAARSRRGRRAQLLLALNGEGATVHPVVIG